MGSKKPSFVNDLILKGILLDETSIKEIDISPCIADPERIKFMAKIFRDLKYILPILYLSLPNARLTKNPLILSFTTQQHNFILGEKGDLAITYVKDEKEVDYINEKIIELINKGIKFNMSCRLKLDSLVEKKRKLTPMILYDLFPKTNCKECGFVSCFSYTAKIMSGEMGFDKCPYIEPKYIKHVISPIDLNWSIKFGI